AAAGRAGDHRRALLPQLEALEDLVADENLFLRIGGQRDTDGVADAHREEGADADGGADGAGARRAGLGDAEVQRVIVVEGGEAAVRLDQHGDLEGLQAHLGVEEVEILEDLDVAERGADEPLGAKLDLRGVLLRHLVHELFGHRGDGAEVDANADGGAALLGLRDDLADILFLTDIARVEAQAVNAGVEGLEGEGVLEVNVGDERDGRVRDDVGQGRGGLAVRDGDTDDLAADVGELLDLG